MALIQKKITKFLFHEGRYIGTKNELAMTAIFITTHSINQGGGAHL